MSFPVDQILDLCPGPDQGFGVVDEALQDDLDRIDGELMKRGTLGGDGIDWKLLREDAGNVLRRCCHLKAFQAAGIALSQEPSPGDLTSALRLCESLFGGMWPDLHPQGRKAARLRDAWAAEIVQSLARTVSYVWAAERKLPEGAASRIDQLIPKLQEAQLDADVLLEAVKKTKSSPPAEAEYEPAAKSHPGGPATGTPGERGQTSRGLDARGRAALRQDIRAVADRISQFDPQADVAYLMRGYAAWLEHRSLPESDNGTVPQMSMPAFVVEEHQTAAKDPSDGSLQRIEDRLYMSPDWFEGQKIAAEMAECLGYQDIAKAIRQRTARRLDALPGLKNLSYANERPYVSRSIADWVEKEQADTLPDEGGKPDEGNNEETLEDIIREVNEALAASRCGRETALAKLDLARALRANDLDAHANLLIEEILREFETASLPDWDKALLADVNVEKKGKARR